MEEILANETKHCRLVMRRDKIKFSFLNFLR